MLSNIKFGVHFNIMQSPKASCFQILKPNGFLYFLVETKMPKNSTTAVDWKDYQNVSTDKKQLMIGIGVFAAVALFIALAIFFTYRLENSNKEIDSNIYYSIK